MPPKNSGSAKGKAKPKEETPVSDSEEGSESGSESGSGEESPSSPIKPKKAAGKAAVKATPKKAVAAAPVKKATPRKKAAPVFKRLTEEGSTAVPVNVSFDGDILQAKQLDKGAGYGHALNLQAARAFSLQKTVFLTEGAYAGYQAILIKPAAPFNFEGLPLVAKKAIYEYYFASSNVVGNPIQVEGTRKLNDMKLRFAKIYAAGNKNRVALLTVNKEINDQAGQVFWNHTLQFEHTMALNEFLMQIDESVSRVRSVNIVHWVKLNARNAMSGLSNAKQLRELKIEQDVATEADAVRFAKIFFECSYKLLQALGKKDNKAAGVDKLKFGKMALLYKDKKDRKMAWDPQLVEAFKDNLRAKLK